MCFQLMDCQIINILIFKRIKVSSHRGILKNLVLFGGQILLTPIPYKCLQRHLDKQMRKYNSERSTFAADLCFAEYGKISIGSCN